MNIRNLRDQVADKLAEYGKLRRTMLFAAAAGAVLAGGLGWFNTYHVHPEAAPPWVMAGQILGLLMSGGVGLFFALVEDNSADLVRKAHQLEDERDTLHRQLQKEKAGAEALKEVYHYTIALYQFTRSIGDLTDPLVVACGADLRQKVYYAAERLLDFLAQDKGTLLEVGDERWTFNVYTWDAKDERLIMFSCRRWSRESEEQKHREWEKSEGHVGLTFDRAKEQVCGDATDPSVNGLIVGRGDNHRDDDDVLYRSFASVPIMIGGQEQPLGVLVATSDIKDRYVTAAQAQSLGRRNTVEVLKAVADTLATMLALLHDTEGRLDDERKPER